jgi:hypothetical protein
MIAAELTIVIAWNSKMPTQMQQVQRVHRSIHSNQVQIRRVLQQ